MLNAERQTQVTTGASNDLERVASTAKMMVTRFGMSERIGQVPTPPQRPPLPPQLKSLSTLRTFRPVSTTHWSNASNTSYLKPLSTLRP